jgi:hypothetical protein
MNWILLAGILMALYLLRQVRQEVWRNTQMLSQQLAEVNERQTEMFQFLCSAVDNFAGLHDEPDKKAGKDLSTNILNLCRYLREQDEKARKQFGPRGFS